MSATVEVLIEGYAREGDGADLVQPSVSLVQDGDMRMVVDPGILKDPSTLVAALRKHDLAPEDITHVFLTHQHVDHTRNVGLFARASVIDFASVYNGERWGEHEGDGYEITPSVKILTTPGHTDECASLVVSTASGNVVLTHVWWFADMTPEEDPLAKDAEALRHSRKRVLDIADEVIPGHGPRFRPDK